MDIASWAGFTSRPVEIRVEPAPLARALDIDGGDRHAVPPTLPTAWWQYLELPWLSEGQFPVLREQTVELFRPLITGERLTCAVHLMQVRRHGLYRYLTCVLEARAGEQLVATAESLLVLKP